MISCPNTNDCIIIRTQIALLNHSFSQQERPKHYHAMENTNRKCG